VSPAERLANALVALAKAEAALQAAFVPYESRTAEQDLAFDAAFIARDNAKAEALAARLAMKGDR